ncbi:hypothetical protein K0M31_010746 [Melipona bicolor]|uniref:Uncharacterized protein n=1 Tax=Melipona bicolor TaxID=60889 RepID=A0AA40KHX6_9HYME|nr:hypothetical protein K0M31_010746 [Melipona bicolor]
MRNRADELELGSLGKEFRQNWRVILGVGNVVSLRRFNTLYSEYSRKNQRNGRSAIRDSVPEAVALYYM